MTDSEVDSLRSRMDADARFHRVISGYDPDEVRSYLENIKYVFAQQAKASKQQQETLIADLESSKSEIQARNYAIKTMKETLAQREAQLTTANTRIATLIQSVKTFEAERAGIEHIRNVAATANVVSERAMGLEQEVRQLRDTLAQASNLMEAWKNERARLLEENAGMRQELDALRAMIQNSRQDQRSVYVPTVQAQSESRYQAQKESAQASCTQIADRLADAFAEAYALVNQLKAHSEAMKEEAQPRVVQPRMQVLRPDGTASEFSPNTK
jgi:chromosome segregation ATPase